MEEIIKIVGVVLLGLLLIAGIGGVFVYWCWNYVMPSLFGLPEITFIQAIALNILASCLFKTHNTITK